MILIRLLLTRFVPRVVLFSRTGHAQGLGSALRKGSLGLRTIADKIEAAYIASRNATHILCTRIRHSHRGDQNSRDQHLQSAIDALDIMVPGLDVAAMEPDDITQSALNKRISEQNMTTCLASGTSPLASLLSQRMWPRDLPGSVQDA